MLQLGTGNIVCTDFLCDEGAHFCKERERGRGLHISPSLLRDKPKHYPFSTTPPKPLWKNQNVGGRRSGRRGESRVGEELRSPGEAEGRWSETRKYLYSNPVERSRRGRPLPESSSTLTELILGFLFCRPPVTGEDEGILPGFLFCRFGSPTFSDFFWPPQTRPRPPTWSPHLPLWVQALPQLRLSPPSPENDRKISARVKSKRLHHDHWSSFGHPETSNREPSLPSYTMMMGSQEGFTKEWLSKIIKWVNNKKTLLVRR